MVEVKKLSQDKLRIRELEDLIISYQKEVFNLREENKKLKEQLKGENND